MAVRNFWVETTVDGQKTILGGGPKSKTGGVEVRFLMRDKGGKKVVASVIGTADDEGNLVLSGKDEHGNGFLIRTER